ncbi:MAG: dTDP-4-dehydrorhamnose reductase [Bacteroidales bacterium]|nr:dTDP-4-dehydrorhamnose reductase [Bacteroidales bacterium]
MNYLVTGANGQLGCALRLAALKSHDSWLFTDVCDASPETIAMLRRLGGETVDISTARLDVTDADSVRKMLRDNEINAVINCAAYTAVDAAETHPEEARLLNVEAPRILAESVRDLGGLLVHISTDYVFGGRASEPWKETDIPAPLGVYGRTKLEGEIAVAASGCKYMIIRTAWMFSEFGKNFVKTILKLTSEKPQIRVVNDQIGTPTYAQDLADAILQVVQKYSRNGIWHYTNSGQCSWYQFARAIADLTGHTDCRIEPCTTAEYPTAARRPAWSVLDKSRIVADFGIVPPAWEDSLRRCLENLG